MKKKVFRPVIKRIVLFPMVVTIILAGLTMMGSLYSYANLRNRIVEDNVSSLEISASQLDTLMHQIEREFTQHWFLKDEHKYLRAVQPDTPLEQYFRYQTAALDWLLDICLDYDEIEGTFLWYQQSDLLMFRGEKPNTEFQSHIRLGLGEKSWKENGWRLLFVEGKQYLLCIRCYQDCTGGAWLAISELEHILGLDSDGYLGDVYIADQLYGNSLDDPELNAALIEQGYDAEEVQVREDRFLHYREPVPGYTQFSLCMLVHRTSVWKAIPRISKLLIFLPLTALLMIPFLFRFIRKRVAEPITVLDQGMKQVGTGDLDYRFQISDRSYEDEFDLLAHSVNDMLGQLNDTMNRLKESEIALYKTRLSEQMIKLKYVSQQIRPHFILNALNVIYTYEEDEYPLIQKMVLYLTEYFRYIVNLNADYVALEKEMHHIQNYLYIQKERYLDRFEFFVEWEAQTSEAMIPPLIIQTFVENCIKYGMKGTRTSYIFVLAGMQEDKVKLMIADSGEGFSEDTLSQIRKFQEKGIRSESLGVGIINAIERMNMLYEEPVSLRAYNAETGGAVIEILLPVLKGGKTDHV